MQTSIKIGKNTFLVPAPGGMRSFSLQQKILPVASRLGAALGAIAKVTKTEDLMGLDVEKILPEALPYVSRVFSEMPAGELESIARELLRDAKFDGLPLFGQNGEDAFDALMSGRTLDIWKLLWHAIKVWYPDFFSLAGTLVAKKDEPASRSEASSTSPQPGPASV